jgi:hypothetical protein
MNHLSGIKSLGNLSMNLTQIKNKRITINEEMELLKQEIINENKGIDKRHEQNQDADIEAYKGRCINVIDNLFMRTIDDKMKNDCGILLHGSNIMHYWNSYRPNEEAIVAIELEKGLEDIEIFHELEHFGIDRVIQEIIGFETDGKFAFKGGLLFHEYASSHATPQTGLDDCFKDCEIWCSLTLQQKRSNSLWTQMMNHHYVFSHPEKFTNPYKAFVFR